MKIKKLWKEYVYEECDPEKGRRDGQKYCVDATLNNLSTWFITEANKCLDLK